MEIPRRPGRPKIDPGIRALIRKMATANPLWGAPQVHGELLKLGIEISQTSVGKYMPRRRRPPSQTWRTFLDNHVKHLVSIDFFTVRSVTFRVLFVFVVLAHHCRRVLHFNVTQGQGTTRYPDHYLCQRLGLVCLAERTRNFPWAKA